MKILVTGGGGFIGSNFVQTCTARGLSVLDLSLDAPLDPMNSAVWKQGDILDGDFVRALIADFAPDAVVHLAARAECDETTTVDAGYRMNTDGTANILAAVRATPSVKRLVVTSSQYVCGPQRQPTSEEDYFPATIYGVSKVITEQLTRAAGLACAWTIIRPTNVWGPWHMRYAREFWKVAQRGWYVHPGGAPVIRSYAFVGTVIEQIFSILEAPRDVIDRKTLYTTDAPDDIYHWANAFCLALRGTSARRVPRAILMAAGMGGEIIGRVTHKPFYINWSRYQSMITSYPTPYRETFDKLGCPSQSLEQGVTETVQWLRSKVPGFEPMRTH